MKPRDDFQMNHEDAPDWHLRRMVAFWGTGDSSGI